jgi:hypothetical protein
MKDAEVKSIIASCALSGVTVSIEKMLPGYKLTECDTCLDDPRSVQIVVVGPDNWPRVFEFTVRELMK